VCGGGRIWRCRAGVYAHGGELWAGRLRGEHGLVRAGRRGGSEKSYAEAVAGMRWVTTLLTVGWLAAAAFGDGPLAPADALKSFELADDRLAIDLVAAEPDVIDPVAMAFDESGRIYVAEM